MTTVRLDGASLAFSGKIKGYTKSSLQAHLSAQGAHVSSSPNGNLDLFLVGDRAAYKKVDKAKALGLTIIEGDALYTLLEAGEVTLEEAPVRPLAELIADARAAFDGSPSREAWAAICALADECDDAQIDDFVAYLTPQLDAWPRVVDYSRDGHVWEFGQFTHGAGEARLMPSEWLTSMLNGEQHPKHSLATAVSFSSAAVNNTISMGLLDNPDLAHVRTFDIGANLNQNVKKKSFYKKMASCEHLQNVDTLTLSRAPAKAFAELAKATSLPNLKRIFIRHDVESMGADLETAIFGPWASQLECVCVKYPKHLDTLAARLDELPSLTTLAIGTAARTEPELFEGMARSIKPLLGQLREVMLGLSTMDDEGKDGLGVLFAALDTDLDVLDIRACGMMTLSGPTGVAFAQKHIIDNGLGARIGELRVEANVSAEVCAVLRDAGVNVTSPLDDVPGEAEAPAFAYIEELAPGEAERVAAHEVHVHDAMMFSAPSSNAWSTLTSVVDGLERQLEPDAFAQAIETLQAHLEPWPDNLRRFPERWLGELLAAQPSPKILLARELQVVNSYQDPKGIARFWTAVAAAGNVGHIELLRVAHAGKQKFFLAMAEALFEAVKPSAYSIYWAKGAATKALEEALSSKGLLPDPNPTFAWTNTEWATDPDVLKMREVAFKVTSPETLQSLFEREDMDHVISLDVTFKIPWTETPDPGWSEVTAAPASWRRLRHLRVNTGTMLPEDAFGPLVTWLSQARPVQFDDAFSFSAPYDTPVLGFIEAGVYARTYGSSITLPSRFDQDQAEELLGRPDLHVSSVAIMYGSYDVPDTLDLITAMHPSLRQGIKVLKWPAGSRELTQIDALLSGLPALSTWSPICPDLRTREGRAPMLAALAASPASAQLAQLRTIGAYSEQEKVKAAELKVLDKGAGMKSSGWIIAQT